MITIPTDFINNRAAWTRHELKADQGWIFTLGSRELEELEENLNIMKTRRIPFYKLQRSDLVLPSLKNKIMDIVEEVESGRGVVLLRGLDLEKYDAESIRLLYWFLALYLGKPISQNSKGELIGSVRDRGNDYNSENVRGYTTSSRLAPHCDSADVVTLLCLQTSKSGGESVIVSSTSLFNKFLQKYPKHLPYLFQGYHFDLRGEGAKGDRDEVTNNRVPIYSFYKGILSCRYNEKTIIDGQIKINKPLSGIKLEAIKLLGELAMERDIQFDMKFERGDIQILNNHSILHSREGFEDWPEPEKKRNLLRIWLNLDEHIARPLASDFSDRLNTGPRGGVAIRKEYSKGRVHA